MLAEHRVLGDRVVVVVSDAASLSRTAGTASLRTGVGADLSLAWRMGPENGPGQFVDPVLGP